MTMKVLQVINNLDIGGAETVLKNYVLNNNDMEIENHICLLGGSDTFILNQLSEKNIKIYRLNLKSKYLAISALKNLRKIISGGGYDCVHMHLFPGQYYGAKLAKEFKNVHFIFTEHSTFNKRRELKMLYPLEKWSYGSFEKIICVSEMTCKTLGDWMPSIKSKLNIVYGGIVIKKVNKRDEPLYDAVLVGSLRGNEKGVDIFIKAIKKIEDQIRRVAIVGDGVLKSELIELRDSLNISDKVEFVGNVDNVNDYLANSRVFVLPSRWEGFGLAILEAMAVGMPVIASNVGGIPEIIEDGKDGILVPVEDIDALSKNILDVLTDLRKASSLSENAYRKVREKFSIEAHVVRLNNIYKSMMV
jgi:glycosyltransferase involved in cell wall biosynthesis